jgi:hypothetical protein
MRSIRRVILRNAVRTNNCQAQDKPKKMVEARNSDEFE